MLIITSEFVRNSASPRNWFSGKILRCHRGALGSIPRLRIDCFFLRFEALEQTYQSLVVLTFLLRFCSRW